MSMRIFLLVLLLAFIACTHDTPVCTPPYIVHGNTCCLDMDNNSICDVAEKAGVTNAADCSLCPPKFVTQKDQVIVYKYVCSNESIMDKAEDCMARVVSTAKLFTPNNDQDQAYIKTFDARPACRGKYKAAELHL